jgi:hypothetical protein
MPDLKKRFSNAYAGILADALTRGPVTLGDDTIWSRICINRRSEAAAW